MDPKTWLFALFSALDNVPNSLTNQRQIITASFGFSNLQTTLLGCVDGLIEIVTISIRPSTQPRSVVCRFENPNEAVMICRWFVRLFGTLSSAEKSAKSHVLGSVSAS